MLSRRGRCYCRWWLSPGCRGLIAERYLLGRQGPTRLHLHLLLQTMRTAALAATLALFWWPHYGIFDATASAISGAPVEPIVWALDPRPVARGGR